MAMLSLATGQSCDGWNADADGDVSSLFNNGTYLYAGGGFGRLGGAPRPSLAAFPLGSVPTANAAGVVTDEDTPVNGTLTGVGVNSFTLLANGTLGTAVIDNQTGDFTYTPNADLNGVDSFTFLVNDGCVDSAAGTITVTVNPINDPPVATDGVLTAVAGTTASGNLTANDVDNDALAYGIVANGSQGAAVITDPATGAFTYTPGSAASGTDTFTFRADDGAANSNVATITVTIAAGPTLHVLTTTVMPPNGGTIARSPNSSSYSAGTVVSLAAQPGPGFRFLEWRGDAFGTTATIGVTMDADKAVTAVFADLAPANAIPSPA